VPESDCRIDVALRTRQGLYVTALPCEGNWRLAGIARRILSCENRVALKTAHSTYVSAKNELDEWRLKADADRILGWEVFHLEEQAEWFTLRTAHGDYVTSGDGEPSSLFRGSRSLDEHCYFQTVRL
jgi:hypothetical protein